MASNYVDLSTTDSAPDPSAAVSGSVAVTNFPASQNVAVTTSALPTGAATNAAVSAVQGSVMDAQLSNDTKLDAINAKLPSGLVVVTGRLQVQLPAGSSGLTDTELRASALPVSAASLPLPIGAATETSLSALNTKIPSGLTVTTGRLQVELPAGGTGLTNTEIRATALPVSLASTTVTNTVATTLASTTITGSVAVTGPLTDAQIRLTALPVSLASTTVSNFPATQAVSGTVTANIGTTNGLALDATLTGGAAKAVLRTAAKGTTAAADTTSTPVDLNTQALDVSVKGTVPVSGTFFQTTQPVSIAATVAVSGPLTDTQLRLTPVPISGSVTTGGLTDTQIRATALPVSGTVSANATLTAETTKVIGTVNISAGQTVAVTGGLTDTQLRATAVPVSLASTTVTNTVAVSGPLTDTQLRATAVPISGSVTSNIGTTNGLALDVTQTNGTAKSRLLDSGGVAIDGLNSGAGLNALNVAFTGTNYISSVNNSSVAQLASLATFTGVLDNTFNQQAVSILITSDQPGTLTLKQYSDAAGTRKVPDMVFTHPAGGVSRSITLNGNYSNIVYKNTGFATTTTLKIDVSFGTLPATTALGNAEMSLDEINGTSITPRPDGFLRVAADPVGLLYDTFETLDTTNTWTVGGTAAPTGTAGNLAVAAGTAANATSYAKSIPFFQPSSSAYLQTAYLIQIEAAVVTGSQRFWGIGTYVTPTPTVPVTNGAIFEIDSATGNLLASVYSNSVRTQSTQITRPTDGAFHRYALYYKASRVYYELDNVQVATFSFPNPQVATFNTVIGSTNGAAVVASAPVLNATLIGIADTARNSTKLSDGTFAWRTATIKPASTAAVAADTALVVAISPNNPITTAPVDGVKATYSASAVNIASAALATDVFTITGSATKTVRILQINVSGTQTTAGQITISLLKRSTANTVGTSTTSANVPHDSNSAAATATVLAYTANPTTGTLVGVVRPRKLALNGATGTSVDEAMFNFGDRPGQAIVLRGTSQVFAINLNATTVTGGSFSFYVEWTEE